MSFTFYHASSIPLEIGTILKPISKRKYEELYFSWIYSDWNTILSKYKPNGFLDRESAVFCVDDNDTLDLVGVPLNYVYWVEPLSEFSRHDMEYIARIEHILHNPYRIEDNKDQILQEYAEDYWNGVFTDDPVIEVLCSSAKVVKLLEFNKFSKGRYERTIVF